MTGRYVCAFMRARHRTEKDGVGVAVGIPLIAYALVFGLFALWLHSLLQPRVFANPGLAAYAPPPATVISYGKPARLLAEHGQAPTLAEFESPPEQPTRTLVESKPERTVDVTEPKRPKAKRPRERHNPFRDYATAYRWYGGYRPSSNYAFQGSGGFRPF
jgi:hypothetical protein